MEILWFCLVAFTLAMYVVFDGFDLGAGAIHLAAARNSEERKLILGSIGPVWDGNEVWLLAAGGTLYFAFPSLYASSLSGFYLPLTMVLWLLILRGIAVEFRNHIESVVWMPLWDATFGVASALLAFFFGVALGNVVRGVPVDASGRFFEPLWTTLQPFGKTGILDWFTVLVGLTALAALAMHGALWVALKTTGPVMDRARRLAAGSWWGTVGLTACTTFFALWLQPQILLNLRMHWWGAVFPAAAVLGLTGVRIFLHRHRERDGFLASCVYLIGMLASAAFGVFPYVLPSSIDPALGLTVAAAAAAPHGLRVALIWWVPGMALVTVYFAVVYRRFAGKVGEQSYGL